MVENNLTSTEKLGKKEKQEDMEDFYTLFEQSIAKFREGEIIKGAVVQINPNSVVVDIGYKSEGEIPVEEFYDESGKIKVQVGDKVDVYLESIEDEEGLLILSREKASKIKVWEEVANACKEEGVIEGKIVARIKGGLAVDIGVKAFLPGSQIDIKPVRNLDRLVGETWQFKVIKYNEKNGNIVLSRRILLEEERKEQRTKLLQSLEEGSIVEGVVKNITDYGAFIDLGGIDGLLHITDMSWGRIAHPSEILSLGEKIKTKVIKFDQEKERVSLGLKQLKPDPWEGVNERYNVGDRVKGEVVNLTDYGAFVELEKGVEGLIHVSEMSWTKKIKTPSQILSLGNQVEAVILEIGSNKKRISLGLKQIGPNPWEVLKEKYPPGTRIRGEIKNITDFGIFVGVEEGIDGLIHISDVSWSKRAKHPSELGYKKGQEIEVVVLNVDIENERFALGIKQATKDPWEEAANRYKPGMIVEGIATNITNFGVFLEIEEGIEGLIHVSEWSHKKIDDLTKVTKVGEKLTAEVLNVEPEERRIALSIRSIEIRQEREYLEKAEIPSTKLGDLMGINLKEEGTQSKEVERE